MSVTLKKEKIQTSELVYQKYNRITVESDVNVPDINPDILKVLDVNGYITVSEKSIRNSKLYVCGTATITVLYAPDGDVFSSVKSLISTHDFNHTIDIPETDGSESLYVETEAETFSYTLLNSRKISLRCIIGVNTKLTRPTEIELASNCEDACGICTKSRKIRVCNSAVNSENRISVCEQRELSSDMPSVSEILKTTVTPELEELIMSEDKAIVKGQMKLCTLYISVDDGSVQKFEYTLPFGEALDAIGAEDDMDAEIDFSVSNLYCEVRDDSDGEPRIIGIDLCVSAVIRGISIIETEVMTDAYSTESKTSLTHRPVKIEQLHDNTTTRLTHKSSLSIPDTLPEIQEVCDVRSSASVNGISISTGEILISGTIKTSVLYIAADDDLPLCSYTDTSEFSHCVPSPGIPDTAVCDARTCVEHTSFSMNGSRDMETRTVLGISVRSFTADEISTVGDIELLSDYDRTKQACISICFASEGNTLWDIAKRYRTTVDSVKEQNKLTSDTLNIGQQIKICR